MLRKLILYGTLATGLSTVALGCGVIAPVTEPLPAENTPVVEPPGDLASPKPKRVKYGEGCYWGVVSAVGPDWFELGKGWEGELWIRKPPQDHTKPKRISAAGTRAGGVPKGEGEQRTHRVADLKVGDKVVVMIAVSRDGEEWPAEIMIRRRPGGKIPPQFGDVALVLAPERAFHLSYQAEQDWEEKGVPIPAKYLPNGRAWWTNPPYPPVAPLPRPGILRTEAPSPRQRVEAPTPHEYIPPIPPARP
jgi:hypothetical protein